MADENKLHNTDLRLLTNYPYAYRRQQLSFQSMSSQICHMC